MSCYLYQASYSGAAIKTLVENPQDRTGAAKAAIEANGGTMIGAWMAFGSDDLVVVADMPDDASMAAVALAVSATGAIEGGSDTHRSPKRMPASGTHTFHTACCSFAFSARRFTVSASGRASGW